MNNKELSEIKKNFNDVSGLFTLNRVVTAYVDAEKHIRCKTNRLYSLIPEAESAVFMETLSKVFKGTLGKGLLEYEFPSGAYDEGGTQALLYRANRAALNNDELSTELITHITENLEYDTQYALIIGHCTYSIMSKDKNDESNGEASEEYNFIVTAVCPANTSDDGLYYNAETNAIAKKSNTDLIIAKEPTDGFFFPVFSDRTPDVNSVMYFTKKPKEPNVSIINDVLGCEFTMSADREKDTFQAILKDAVGEELTYTVITQVNDRLRNYVAMNKNETTLPSIDVRTLREMLSDAGVSAEKLEALTTVFEEKVGNKATLTVSNLIDNKTTLVTPDVTVSVGKDASDKIRSSVTDGKRSLVIDLDDPNVQVNGLYTHL